MPYVSVLKVVLSPILLFQGRRARRTALRLPEAQGQRSGYVMQDGHERELNLLFVGDSTMAGVGVAQQDVALASLTAARVSSLLSRSVRWQMVAKSGLKTGEVIALAEQEELLQPDVLITALGGNDVLGQTKPHRFLEAYEKLIERFMPTAPACRTVISGLPPLHITPAVPQPLRWFFGVCAHQLDRRLRRWVKTQRHVSYVSLQWAADRTRLAADRFHPGEGLYLEWAHRLAQQIAQDCFAVSV